MKFSDQECRMMKEYIYENASICYETDPSFSKDNINLNRVLHNWKHQKSHFLSPIFGDELILRRPISYTMSDDEYILMFCREMIKRFGHASYASPHCDEIVEYFYQWATGENEDEIYPECMRIDTEERNWIYFAVRELFSCKSVSRNIYEGHSVKFKAPDGNLIRLTPGSKAFRLINKIVKAFNFDAGKIELVRQAQSEIATKRVCTGTMCLSIHPLDYMTMSDNNSHWSSCMSWVDRGSYRRGTVEMMNSPMVVVGYLESEDKVFPIGQDNWNSKKWRCLFIVNPDIICNVKAYPYKNDELSERFILWLRELVQNTYPQHKYTDIQSFFAGDTCFTGSPWLKEHNVITHFEAGYMYNDFDHTTNLGVFSTDYEKANGKEPVYVESNYSGPSNCMVCGYKIDSEYADALLCLEHENMLKCVSCGCTLHEDYKEYGDEHYCHDCFDELFALDYVTDEYMPSCECYSVFLTNSDLSEVYRCGDSSSSLVRSGFTIHKDYVNDKNLGSHYWLDRDFNRVWLDINTCKNTLVGNIITPYWNKFPSYEAFKESLLTVPPNWIKYPNSFNYPDLEEHQI